MKPLFLGGVRLGGGRLTSHETNDIRITSELNTYFSDSIRKDDTNIDFFHMTQR